MTEPRAPSRLAVRVAYDGAAFHGSQRQPGLRTVEGDVLRALARVGAVADAAAARFLAASRTDKGVSAAGNVVAFDTAFDRAALLGAVNAHLEDAWAVAVAPAPPEFNPRASDLRRYRYFQRAADVPDAEAFEAALALFSGEHDFSSFARVEPHRSPVRTVGPPRVRREGAFLACDFEAPSFLWNQVRRMVGAGLAVARGDAALVDVRAALASPASAGRDFGVAAPEPLVLLEVRHALPWEADARARDRVASALGERLARLELARAVTRAVAEGAGVATPVQAVSDENVHARCRRAGPDGPAGRRRGGGFQDSR